MREYLVWLALTKHGVNYDEDLIKDIVKLIEDQIRQVRMPQLTVILHHTDLGSYLARGISEDIVVFEHIHFVSLQEVRKFFEKNYENYNVTFNIPEEWR